MTTTRDTMMPTTLLTPRLRLRAPVLADAPRIAMFIGDWDVAKMLAQVPHPYREEDAEQWIGSLQHAPGQHFVVVHANGVIGVVGVEQRPASGKLELGYWLAKPFWGRGLMTEAASAVIKALRACDPSAELTCSHFEDNAASAAVIGKLGFILTCERQLNSKSRGHTVRSLSYRLPLNIERAARHVDDLAGVLELEHAGGGR